MESTVTTASNNKLKRNYVFNVLSRLFSIIVPIISTPYLSSILGADGIGKYSYVASYSTYFVLLASLGFSVYGQRLIASNRDDKKKTTINFIELYSSQFFVGFAVLAFFVIFAFFQPFGDRYRDCFFVEIITVASVLFEVEYFFEGYEEYGKITIRNIIIKSLSLVALFAFVKKREDVWIYALIINGSIFLTNISIWPFIIKRLVKVDKKEIKPFRHLPKCALLFLPTVAYKIYPIIDKTLIGLITKEDSEVGNYAKAQQIVDSCTTLVLALGSVFTPRNSNLYASGKEDEVKNNVYSAFDFVWLMSFPLCFGLAGISDNFIPWYLNDSYFSSASGILKLLSITIVLMGIRNVYGLQYLISTKQDTKYVVSVLVGAVFNVLLTVPLVFAFKNYGAAIASVFTELLICFLMYLFTRKKLSLNNIFSQILGPFVAGFIMFVLCYKFSTLLKPSIGSTFILIGGGAIVYFAILLLMRDKTFLKLLSFVTKPIKARKKNGG